MKNDQIFSNVFFQLNELAPPLPYPKQLLPRARWFGPGTNSESAIWKSKLAFKQCLIRAL
jgi:hypothetical protein